MLDEVEIAEDETSESEESSQTSSPSRSLSAGALFLAALGLLFWNESNSKRHSDALNEVAELVQAAGSSIDPALEGQPVHLSARVTSQAGARDPAFGISTDGVALYRHVEMFQWIEFEETSGRGRKKETTVTYVQDWDSYYHDSSQFQEPKGHENPKPALQSDGFFAADARFGPYRFDNREVAQKALDRMDVGGAPGSLGAWPKAVEVLPELSAELTAKRWYTLEPGVYYRGNQAAEEPELGDLHVSFYSYANDFPLTMLAAQSGDRLAPWRASNGDEILLARGGSPSAKQMIADEQGLNTSLTKLLRIVGLIGAVLGGAGLAGWLGSFLSMIPIVGRLVEMSFMVTGAVFGLFAGLLTIAIGWLAARPWIAALILLAIGGAISWAIYQARGADQKKRRAKRAIGLAAAARERAAQALAAITPASGHLAGAAAGTAPPPPPPMKAPGSVAPTKRIAPVPADDPKELAPLEWTPGLIASKPPAVRPRADAPTAAQTMPPAPSAPPKAPSPAGNFDSVPKAASPALFDTVPLREQATPDAPVRSATPMLDSVPMRAAPLFDSVPMREATPAPLFDSVPMREATPAPLFDSVPMREAAPNFIDELANLVAAPAPASKDVRVALGSKGDYALSKMIRQHADGKQEVLCFELSKAGALIKRGSQEEVKEALRRALTGI